jgi:hypothetical protein
MVLDSISSLQFPVHIMRNEFTELSQILIKLPQKPHMKKLPIFTYKLKLSVKDLHHQ